MDHDDAVRIAAASYIILAGAYLTMKRRKIPRRRRWWMKSASTGREEHDGSDMFADLVREPAGGFHNFCRMSSTDFELLLNAIGPRISKRDTHMRKAIPPKERLAVTLRYLSSGDSFQSLSYLFKFSSQSISKIIPEVCKAIIEAQGHTAKLPNTAEEWVEISDRFETKWQFPRCCGSLDGRHILIQSTVFNQKRGLSIVLMALVDADYCFTFADVGCEGRVREAGTYQNSLLFQYIDGKQLPLPQEEPLYGREAAVPYVFVADDAIASSSQILTPYSETEAISSRENIFNYRLTHARQVAENAFGIVSSVFRILRKPLLLEPESASVVAMTCIILHNFLRRSTTSRSKYTPDDTFDSEENGNFISGSWRQDTSDMVSLLPLKKADTLPGLEVGLGAEIVRSEYADFFMSDGHVDAQEKYA